MGSLVDFLKQLEMDFSEEETFSQGLARILKEVSGICHTKAGAIFVRDFTGETLRLGTIHKLQDHVVQDVFTKHKEEILNPLSASSKEYMAFRDQLYQISWVICVLRAKQNISGLIFLQISDPESVFSPAKENALSVILTICSIFLDNAFQRATSTRALMGMAKAFSASLDAKDHCTKGHAERVTLYASAIVSMAEKYLPEYFIPHSQIRLAGLLHDIGKIGIPDNILCKPGKLTVEEFDIVKSHAEIGRKMLEPIPELKLAMNGTLHHERYDGHGYPLGLTGDKIPLIARILSVADAYDAMTSDRPYRPQFNPNVAFEEIQDKAGTQFDPAICELFKFAFNEGLIHSLLQVHSEADSPKSSLPVPLSQPTASSSETEICNKVFSRIGEVRFGTSSGPALIAILENPDISIKDIAARVQLDATLMARLLQLANSSFYSFRRKIRTIEQAIILIGLKETRRIVHLANMMSLFQNAALVRFDVKEIWKHSLVVGLIAKSLARRFGQKRLVEDAFLTGVMHDIGKLAMINLHGERYENVITDVLNHGMTFAQAEIKEFGISHDRASAYLIEKWNLPAFLAETFYMHHADTDLGDNRLLSRILKAADDLSYRISISILPDYPKLSVEDEAYLVLGIQNQLELDELIAKTQDLVNRNEDLFRMSITPQKTKESPPQTGEPLLAGKE